MHGVMDVASWLRPSSLTHVLTCTLAEGIKKPWRTHLQGAVLAELLGPCMAGQLKKKGCCMAGANQGKTLPAYPGPRLVIALQAARSSVPSYAAAPMVVRLRLWHGLNPQSRLLGQVYCLISISFA